MNHPSSETNSRGHAGRRSAGPSVAPPPEQAPPPPAAGPEAAPPSVSVMFGEQKLTQVAESVLPALLSLIRRPWFPAVAGGAVAGAAMGLLFFQDKPVGRRAPVGAVAGPAPRIAREMPEFPLGFYKDAIPGRKKRGPAQVVDVTTRPEIVFQGYRLCIPTEVAMHFAIADIRVAHRSQLANDTMLPAAAFAQNATSIRLSLDEAAIQQEITLCVVNESPKPQRFIAALVGTAVG